MKILLIFIFVFLIVFNIKVESQGQNQWGAQRCNVGYIRVGNQCVPVKKRPRSAELYQSIKVSNAD